MKIILSPSKTKKIAPPGEGAAWEPEFCPAVTQALVEYLAVFSPAQLAKVLKIKEDKAAALCEFYQNYEKQPPGGACASYSGLAFKNLA